MSNSVSPQPQLKSYKDIPGPKGLPLIGSAYQFARPDRLKWLSDLNREHGPIFRLTVFKENYALITEPDIIQYVLQANYKNYIKESRAFNKVRIFLGKGLVTNDGESWKKQRRLAQPAFHRERIAGLTRLFTSRINIEMELWEGSLKSDQPIDLAEAMMRLTLDIVSRSMFSSALKQEEFDKIARIFVPILKETNRRIFFPFVLSDKMPFKDARNYERNIAELDRIVYKIIERRRNQPGSHDDLLDMLMSARDEESGQAMDDKQLRDEVMTIFLAGHETTGVALSWTWWLLHKNPDVKEKLRQEVDQVVGNRVPEVEDFPQLKYTRWVFEETMRLFPPVPIFLRTSIREDVLGDYRIPPGLRVLISPYMVHRRPDIWSEPESFKPERFQPELAEARPRFSYLPFGGGPRVCIGNNFATMEAVLALAMISREYELDILEADKVKQNFTLTLRPNRLMARVKRI